MKNQSLVTYFTLLYFFLTSVNSFSQEITIWEMQHSDGENIIKDDAIKIMPGDYADLQFIMEISNLKDKTGDLTVFTKKSKNDSPVQQGSVVNISEKNNSFLSVHSIKLNSLDFNVTEGSVYAEFKDESGVTYTSNSYSITIVPDYQITNNSIEEVKH